MYILDSSANPLLFFLLVLHPSSSHCHPRAEQNWHTFSPHTQKLRTRQLSPKIIPVAKNKRVDFPTSSGWFRSDQTKSTFWVLNRPSLTNRIGGTVEAKQGWLTWAHSLYTFVPLQVCLRLSKLLTCGYVFSFSKYSLLLSSTYVRSCLRCTAATLQEPSFEEYKNAKLNHQIK